MAKSTELKSLERCSWMTVLGGMDGDGERIKAFGKLIKKTGGKVHAIRFLLDNYTEKEG